MGIVGGAKISSKIGLLKLLVKKLDKLALGGKVAEVFLACKKNYLFNSEAIKSTEDIDEIVATATSYNCELIVPVDFSCSDSEAFSENPSFLDKHTILDIGSETVKLFKKHIAESKMIFWNGALGIFEQTPFDFGTRTISQFIAEKTRKNKLLSIVGGGDTLFALKKFGLTENMSHVSSAGGALLYYLSSGDCPALEAIRGRQDTF